MKATGIVRRIEEYGIIGQKSKKPHKYWAFNNFWLDLICTKITYFYSYQNSFSQLFTLFVKYAIIITNNNLGVAYV